MKKLILLMLLGILTFPCAAKVVSLTENGKAKAEIVIAEKATVSAQTAALELQHHVKYITGAALSIVKKQSGTKFPIFVGDSPAVRKMGINPAAMKRQQYTLDFRNNAIILAGKDAESYKPVTIRYVGINTINARNLPGIYDAVGTLYAVHDFLRDYCGVEWLDPTDAGTVYKKMKTLKVNGKTVKREPFMSYRGGTLYPNYSPEMWSSRVNRKELQAYRRQAYRMTQKLKVPFGHLYNQQTLLFLLRMKAGGDRRPANHSFYDYYERFLHKKHRNFEYYRPQYFAQKDGRTAKANEFIFSAYDSAKEPPQLCYSNPETIAQILKDIRNYFNTSGYKKRFRNIGVLNAGHIWGEDTFCVEAMDNSGFCECDNCKKDYEPHRAKERSQHSTYWFKFVNKIAREIKKTHPGKKISTLAYGTREGLPTNVKLEDNVIVYFCMSGNRMPYSKLLGSQMNLLERWRKAYPKATFAMWLYNTFPYERSVLEQGYNVFPGFFGTEVVRQFKEFKRLNIRGGIFHCGFKDDFENYMTLRLMVNPDLTLKQLKDTYFASYGKAEKDIRAFYDIVEKRYCDPASYKSLKRPGHQNKFIAWGLLGTKEIMDKLAYHMKRAEQLADTPQAKARVANWKAGIWDYMVKGKRQVSEIKVKTKGVRVVRTEYNGGAAEAFGPSILKGKLIDIYAPTCSWREKGKLIKNQAKVNWLTDGKFHSKPTMTGDAEQVLYYYTGPVKDVKRLRISLMRGLRVTAYFTPVALVNGQWVAICDNIEQYQRTNWPSGSAEGPGAVTIDIYFDKGAFPANAKGIGILDQSSFKHWYYPEYIQLEAK